MELLDWFVMLSTLFGIVIYGVVKTRKNENIHSYFLGGKSMGWAAIGLSVMATQASAITFISTPGQAYESGMGFIQILFLIKYLYMSLIKKNYILMEINSLLILIR